MIGELLFFFICSASDGLARTPFLLKETWTPLPLVEAGNDFLGHFLLHLVSRASVKSN